MLLVLNGAPGVGKSTLAERYAREHALALVVEIDDLRRRLGQWWAVEESRIVARELAVALVRAHLGAGRDVILPQFFGRPEFVDRLTEVARDAGTPFYEVILTDDGDRIIERFRRRRAVFDATGVLHPEADLTADRLDAEIRSASERLRTRAHTRSLALIDAGPGLESSYLELRRLVATS